MLPGILKFHGKTRINRVETPKCKEWKWRRIWIKL